ncbi:MAG TPA: hypothetical protein VLJ58_15735 [Ramlibacter sp.]|nr:hypothetical protein [Ramlibacter sp.]
MRHDLLNLPWRMLRGAFSGLLALLILFEEWGWEPLQRGLAWIGRRPGLRWIEGRIRVLPPYGALAILLLPSLLLIPVKLLALWLLGQGQVMLGTSVIVAAKIVGTALVARLFTLTQATLMQLPWFARLYARWHAWKQALLDHVRASWPWRAARAFKRGLKRRWQKHARAWRQG